MIQRRQNPHRELNTELFEQLGRSFLRPTRAAEAEIRAAIGKTRDRRAAWERLSARGLLPDWLFHDPERRFGTEPWPGVVLERPATMDGVVTVASDPAGVHAVEQYGREWYARMRRLQTERRPLSGIIWRVLPRSSSRWGSAGAWRVDGGKIRNEAERGMMEADRHSVPPTAIRSTTRRFVEAMKTITSAADLSGLTTRPFRGPVSLLEATVRNAITFDDAGSIGAMLRPNPSWDAIAEPTPFASILNPFAPALDVYAAGYAIYGLHFPNRTQETWLVLAAPSASTKPPPRRA